jgi:hypothetical protein
MVASVAARAGRTWPIGFDLDVAFEYKRKCLTGRMYGPFQHEEGGTTWTSIR